MDKASRTAKWEEVSLQKQRMQNITLKQKAMNAQHDDVLHDKKRRLADLYNEEMNMWREEMGRLRESTGDKQQA
jgi:hypothetical protein